MIAETLEPKEPTRIWRTELQLPTRLKGHMQEVAEWSGMEPPAFIQQAVYLRRHVGRLQEQQPGNADIYVEGVQLNPTALLSAYRNEPTSFTTFNFTPKFKKQVER